jgi:RNA polymerase sigma-70 factor (ECF subfamily)
MESGLLMTDVQTDPSELLRQVRAGDGPALGPLLERYRNYLAVLARTQLGRRLQGKVDPLDVVQETFLEAHRDFAQFRGTTEAEFARWLRQALATNLANLLRRYYGTQSRDVRLECELEVDLDHSSQVLGQAVAAPHSTPSQQAARREQAVLLADALEGLPADYRDVIILRHLEGLTFPEVARRLNRTVDSVEKLWARGLTRLRQSFGGSA